MIDQPPENAADTDKKDPLTPVALAFLNSDTDKLDNNLGAYIQKYHSRKFNLLMALTVATMVILIGISLADSLGIFIYAAFWTPFIILLPFGLSMQKEMENQFTKHFADSMGYVYSPAAPAVTFTGLLFRLWTNQNFSNVMLGIYQGHAIRLFDYSFRRQQGKNNVECSYTVLEVQFEKDLPVMEAVHRQASFLQVSNFFMTGNDLYKSQTLLQTEGNFNDYFSVFVPSGTETEGLEIIAPDLMATLIDHYRDFDFECSGRNLYIFLIGKISTRTKQDFLQLYSLADILIPKLDEMLAD